MSKKSSKQGSPVTKSPRTSKVKQKLSPYPDNIPALSITTLNDSENIPFDPSSLAAIPIAKKGKPHILFEDDSRVKILSSPADLSPRFYNYEESSDLIGGCSRNIKGPDNSPRDLKNYGKSFKGEGFFNYTKYPEYGTDKEKEITPLKKKEYRKSFGEYEFLKIIKQPKDNEYKLEDKIAEEVIKKIKKNSPISSEVASSLITEHNKDYQDNQGNSFLMHAVQKRNFQIAQKILGLNANPNLRNKEGDTALITALRTQELKIIDLILNVPGINLDIQNRHNECALTLALRYGHKTLAADIVQKTSNFSLYNIPVLLRQAIENNNPFLLEAILRRQEVFNDKIKQDIERQEILGLMNACQAGKKEVVAVLVKFNCLISDGIEATCDNSKITHLIKIGRLVDKSYILEKDYKEAAVYNEVIEQSDFPLFASRLLRTLKEHGLSRSLTLEAYCNSYIEKYKNLFRFDETVKLQEFIDYLKNKFINPSDLIPEVNPGIWLGMMDQSSEAYKKLEGKIKAESKKASIASNLQDALTLININPYNGHALENLNLILDNREAVISIISQDREIEKSCKLAREVLAREGLILTKLNELLSNRDSEAIQKNLFLSETVADDIMDSLNIISLIGEEQSDT